MEEKVIEFRERALAIVQNREESISRRIHALLSLCNAIVTKSDGKMIAKFFFSLSRLDKAWTKMLKTVDGKSLIGDTDERYALTCEQFLVNCIYRYASGADDTTSVRARTLACVLAWWIVKAVACSNGDIIESARAFSAEVEYNQKNLARLFSFCEKFIKIGE